MSDGPADNAAPFQWPLRPWLLAGLLGAAGLLIHLLTHENEDVPWQVAAAAFVFFGSLGAAFTLERGRWKEPALFALVVGLVMAGLAWRAVRAGYRVVEVPITFIEREYGDSKMSRDIVVEALWRITAWGLGSRLERFRGGRAAGRAGAARSERH